MKDKSGQSSEYLEGIKIRKVKIQTVAPKIIKKRIEAINLAFEDYYKNPRDVEGVHQVRVKIRKLRGVLAFFKSMIEPGQYKRIQNDLKDLAGLFGDAREADVFLEEIADIEKHAFSEESMLPKLETVLLDKQKKARAALAGNSEIEAFLIKINGISRLGKKELFLSEKDEKADVYINREVKKWIKKTRKAVEKMDLSKAESVHEVRIRSKKIRYVLESFKSVLGKKEIRQLREFEQIQDDLGYLHDVYVNQIFLKRLEAPELQKEIGVFMGWQLAKASDKMKKYQS